MTDMLPLLPDDKDRRFDSRYRVVQVAAQRAKQIMRSRKESPASKYTKATSMALDEVLHGNVPFLVGEEARLALRDSKRQTERGFDPALLAGGDEDAKEIQQQLSVYIDDSPKPAEVVEVADVVDVPE